MKPSYLHRITLRQMEIFQAVCRLKSYSLAADAMALTQPAVSSQVKQLEELVGEPLINYIGKQLSLTPAGEAVERAARDFRQRLITLEMELAELQGVIQGTLSIALESSAQYFMPKLLAEFRDLHPAVDVQLQVTNHGETVRRAARGLDDLMITSLVPEGEGLTFIPFRENILIAVAAMDHQLADSDAVSLLRLAEENLLVREPGSGTRQAFEQHYLEKGVRFPTSQQLGSLEAVKAGVMAGLGVAVLPFDACAPEVEGNRLCQLPVEEFPLRRSWCVTYPKGKHLTPVTQRFLAFLTAGQWGYDSSRGICHLP